MKKEKHLHPKKMQYFSKWRQEWIDKELTEGEIIQMKKYKYLIRETNG